MKKNSSKKRYNFLIDSSVYDDFSLICDEIGLIRSKQLEHFMKDFVKKHKKLLEELKDEKD